MSTRNQKTKEDGVGKRDDGDVDVVDSERKHEHQREKKRTSSAKVDRTRKRHKSGDEGKKTCGIGFGYSDTMGGDTAIDDGPFGHGPSDDTDTIRSVPDEHHGKSSHRQRSSRHSGKHDDERAKNGSGKPQPQNTPRASHDDYQSDEADSIMQMLDDYQDIHDDVHSSVPGDVVAPKRMYVVHPDLKNVDQLLGPPSPLDSSCYMCSKMRDIDSFQSPEVSELTECINTWKELFSDQVEVAKCIQQKFDSLIRLPANAVRPNLVQEWTLRSIYNHITVHSGRLIDRMDRSIHSLERITTLTERNSVYYAKEGVQDPQSIDDIEIDESHAKLLEARLKLLQASYCARQRLCEKQEPIVVQRAPRGGGSQPAKETGRSHATAKSGGAKIAHGKKKGYTMQTMFEATVNRGMTMGGGVFH